MNRLLKMKYKSGFVTIIGRPNVGKSTLLNKILGQKIVITSDKPQTTRKRIKGILTEEEGQIVFVDTPGVHKPIHKLGEFLLEETRFAIPDTDIILFVVDGSQEAGNGDKWIVQNIFETKVPVILVINKVDLIKDMAKRDKYINTYQELLGDKILSTVKLSAKTGRNIDTLIKNIFNKLPEGPQYFPEEFSTDQNMREIASETIREKILINTHDEIPHSVAVDIDKYEEQEKLIKIMASIYVEQDSQKGIIIGKKGDMLKKIGTEARIEIEELIENKVFLELFVKVKKDWRKKAKDLKELGYSQ
jgi:GTP-binding protein Era